ncbi:erythroid membrane-associated protein-like isoform X3 [Anguilla rostrata]|uniref:erythroid membrane-associated protein-like isoform X3 n=1 Tax=Anguilla rostrata TaxID=7938 RepID=UPI0030CF85A2
MTAGEMNKIQILMCSVKLIILMVMFSHSTMEQSQLHIVMPKPLGKVTGPYQRWTLLPCHFFFDHMVTSESICLTWWRNESGHRRIIYAFENGQRQKQREDPDYSNRTKLYRNISEGSATLRLQILRLQDAGLYVCEVWSQRHSDADRASVNLIVAARPLRQGVISMNATFLSFESCGWLPEPSPFWTDERDRNVTEVTETSITPGEDGLYCVKSVLHRNTSERAHNLHLCYTNPDTGEKQTDIYQYIATNSDAYHINDGIVLGLLCWGILGIVVVIVVIRKLLHQKPNEESPLVKCPRSGSCRSYNGNSWRNL